MPEIIAFTKAVLLEFSRNQKGGTAKFRAALSADVRKRLKWTELQPFESGVKLEGELHAQRINLQPEEGPLAKFQIEIDVKNVYGFNAVKLELEGSRGKGFRHELRFSIDFADQKGCHFLEEYITSVGEGIGLLTVTYVPQQKLDLEGEKQNAQQELATAS